MTMDFQCQIIWKLYNIFTKIIFIHMGDKGWAFLKMIIQRLSN